MTSDTICSVLFHWSIFASNGPGEKIQDNVYHKNYEGKVNIDDKEINKKRSSAGEEQGT